MARKETGIIRHIDDLGRLVIPREIRRNLSIHEGDPFEICYDDDGVYFRKYRPGNRIKYLAEELVQTISESNLYAAEDQAELLRLTRELLATHAKLDA